MRNVDLKIKQTILKFVLNYNKSLHINLHDFMLLKGDKYILQKKKKKTNKLHYHFLETSFYLVGLSRLHSGLGHAISHFSS